MVNVIVMVLGMVLAAVAVMAIAVAMAMVPMVVNDCLRVVVEAVLLPVVWWPHVRW